MKRSNKKKSGLVYSTEHGKMCPACGNPVKQCSCTATTHVKNTTDGVVRVSRQTKGRKGKGVTLISGIPLEGAELKAFGKKLRQQCGSGGTLKNGVLEIQGDHRERLIPLLQDRGWQVKRSGG